MCPFISKSIRKMLAFPSFLFSSGDNGFHSAILIATDLRSTPGHRTNFLW